MALLLHVQLRQAGPEADAMAAEQWSFAEFFSDSEAEVEQGSPPAQKVRRLEKPEA